MQHKPVLVRKYGGSSLESDQRIKAVAADIAARSDDGYSLVVVVSAMGRTTNDLSDLAHRISDRPARRELDMLLSVGERITMSLLSMALSDLDHTAISFTGSQCGIITTDSHTDAEILEVRCDRVREALAAGHIVVVAGYQGVSLRKEITTLGRGGSDVTAVALAAALGAERCEILKDVDGVFTADPHLVVEAQRHERLSYDQMQAIVDAGCGVIHPRAVRFATDHGVPLFVGSSFHEAPGTHIGVITPPAETARPRDVPCPLSLNVNPDASLRIDDLTTHQSCLTLTFSPGEDLATASDIVIQSLAEMGHSPGAVVKLCSTLYVLMDRETAVDALPVLHEAFLGNTRLAAD